MNQSINVRQIIKKSQGPTKNTLSYIPSNETLHKPETKKKPPPISLHPINISNFN